MNNKGFTLIELLIVLALLGIILSIAVPKVDTSSYVLKTQTRSLANDIIDLRQKMMTEGDKKIYKIRIDTNGYSIKENIKVIKTVELPKGFTLHHSREKDIEDLDRDYDYYLLKENEISFNVTGSPMKALTIYLAYNNDKYMKVTIAVGTGRIHMYSKIYEGFSDI